jgi:hypothetical protein
MFWSSENGRMSASSSGNTSLQRSVITRIFPGSGFHGPPIAGRTVDVADDLRNVDVFRSGRNSAVDKDAIGVDSHLDSHQGIRSLSQGGGDDRFAKAIHLSRAIMRNIRENLFFAFIYNALGVPIAAGVLYPFFGVLLSPIIAGAAMSFSSLSVVANALRLRSVRLEPKQGG